MSTVREIIPKKTETERGVGRAMRPFGAMEEFFENFPRRWMDPFALRPFWTDLEPRLEPRFPRVDVLDHDDELVVRAELPGVKKDDLDIFVTDESLAIKVTREKEVEEKAQNFYRRELAHGFYERDVALPVEIMSDKVKAKLHEGILEITLPKAKAVERHKINVA